MLRSNKGSAGAREGRMRRLLLWPRALPAQREAGGTCFGVVPLKGRQNWGYIALPPKSVPVGLCPSIGGDVA